jgi:cellulose biosynthesis protein BcsQ
MRIVATYNLKGGVGKTSAAVNLAALAARSGLRVILWDLDPQGAATYLLRVKPKVRGGARKLVRRRTDVSRALRGTDVEGLDLLPADFAYRNLDLMLDEAKRPTRRLRKVLAPLDDRYDLAILDCAPSISLVSEGVFEAADLLLVPLIPAPLSSRTLEQLERFLRKEVDQPPEVLAFVSMLDGRKRVHKEIVEKLGLEDTQVAATAIPAASDVEQMGVERTAVADFAPRGKAAKAYEELWVEVRRRLEL